ncbi:MULTISPECIES: glycosyltransferase [Salinibaculum]|uniref:glycosyltransferase n=1 Tax=Salinibaculum TaxID=2732368 RepID=UPI0030D359D1
MTLPRVATFTDTYLPTVNGVTYTVKTWRDCWEGRGGRMDVVYPSSDHDPGAGEHPVGSVAFPFYEGFRLGLPRVPEAIRRVDIVHSHTPFGIGIGGMRLARTLDVPLVASYHTPSAEYAEYLSVNGTIERAVRRSATAYERLFLDRAAAVVVPSAETARHVRETVGVSTETAVVPNGVDTDFFRPDADGFRERYGLPDGPLVGYTGRHGHEKRLELLLEAVAEMDRDVTLVLGGDGPARDSLEADAGEYGIDARFLGFLPRADLPAFYASLDVFGFPSPVETQGLVALEANACGTPVAGVDAGALADTITDGENGYKAPAGDPIALADAIERVLSERERLSAQCLDRREDISAERAVDTLSDIYERLAD